MNDRVESRACASTGKMLEPNTKKKGPSRGFKRKEKPGPKYSGVNSGRRTERLARKRKSERISFRTLAGLSPCDRVRVGAELGFLDKLEGTKCPNKCGSVLKLLEAPRQTGQHLELGSLELDMTTLCRYYCSKDKCSGNKNGGSLYGTMGKELVFH